MPLASSRAVKKNVQIPIQADLLDKQSYIEGEFASKAAIP